MKFFVLVPVAPFRDDNNYACLQKFVTRFGRDCVIAGLNERDRVGSRVCRNLGIDVVFEPPSQSSFRLCRLWFRMAQRALVKGADVVLLLGDDVQVYEPDAMIADVQRARDDGNLCVVVREVREPAWPTFLALDASDFVRRTQEIFPNHFVNQDGDPFLYELYRRLGKVLWTSRAYVCNREGGVRGGLQPANMPRYNPVSVPWLHLLPLGGPVLTLEVVVPMTRVSREFLEGVLRLTTPAACDWRVCVCLDAQPTQEAYDLLCEMREVWAPRLRVRLNEGNVGASATRNRLWTEACSDWVLFLDDDVVPDPNILVAYVDAVRANPKQKGFVGPTNHPRDGRAWTEALLAESLHFWAFPATSAPWGVTANLLCYRRGETASRARFCEKFEKTGGGEDVDFCLQLKTDFLVVSEARASHPWRPSAMAAYRRLYQWARSDAVLVHKYRGTDLVFYSFPNFFEISVPWLMLSPRTFWIPIVSSLVSHSVTSRWTSKQGFRSFFLASFAARCASDAGHLWGHLSRRQYWAIGARFDWFFGTLPGYKWRERCRDVFFIAGCLLLRETV